MRSTVHNAKVFLVRCVKFSLKVSCILIHRTWGAGQVCVGFWLHSTANSWWPALQWILRHQALSDMFSRQNRLTSYNKNLITLCPSIGSSSVNALCLNGCCGVVTWTGGFLCCIIFFYTLYNWHCGGGRHTRMRLILIHVKEAMVACVNQTGNLFSHCPFLLLWLHESLSLLHREEKHTQYQTGHEPHEKGLKTSFLLWFMWATREETAIVVLLSSEVSHKIVTKWWTQQRLIFTCLFWHSQWTFHTSWAVFLCIFYENKSFTLVKRSKSNLAEIWKREKVILWIESCWWSNFRHKILFHPRIANKKRWEPVTSWLPGYPHTWFSLYVTPYRVHLKGSVLLLLLLILEGHISCSVTVFSICVYLRTGGKDRTCQNLSKLSKLQEHLNLFCLSFSGEFQHFCLAFHTNHATFCEHWAGFQVQCWNASTPVPTGEFMNFPLKARDSERFNT